MIRRGWSLVQIRVLSRGDVCSSSWHYSDTSSRGFNECVHIFEFQTVVRSGGGNGGTDSAKYLDGRSGGLFRVHSRSCAPTGVGRSSRLCTSNQSISINGCRGEQERRLFSSVGNMSGLPVYIAELRRRARTNQFIGAYIRSTHTTRHITAFTVSL